jgi:hypothetical protein
MPSIEIACLDAVAPPPPPTTSFALIYEEGLLSHRSPSPRFQSDFDALSGVLYHIGNPALRDNDRGAYCAHKVLSEASLYADPPSFLEFDSVHVVSTKLLLNWLLTVSPVGRVLFTSDWQFGPDWTQRFGPIESAEFWRLHDCRELLLNAAYLIRNTP